MQLTEGSVVKILAGHGSGRFCVVVSFSEGWPMVADGKIHSIYKPKKKNPKHLQNVNFLLSLQNIHGNKALRNLLWPYQYGIIDRMSN